VVSFRLRGGTKAQRTAALPVLAAREVAVTTDEPNVYIGDGSTAGGVLAGSGTFVRATAIVDASGAAGSYTTLQAAIDALHNANIKGDIHVMSDISKC
jgi:pectin methylesterase-like acyl-CoA thioesterase